MANSPSTLKKLQGTWDIVALEVDARTMPSTGAQIEIKKDRFTSRGMGATYKGQMVVNDSQTPFTLDLKFTAGPEKGSINRGIFEFSDDGWRLCLQMTGGKRPNQFTTSPGSGRALETLQRAAKKSKAAKPVERSPGKALGDLVPELLGEWAMVSCVQSGQALDRSLLQYGKRVATSDRIKVTMMGRTMLDVAYRMDQAAKSIDYELNDSQTQLGIYDFEEGLLKVNFSSPGQPRPRTLLSASGDGCTATSWKRLAK